MKIRHTMMLTALAAAFAVPAFAQNVGSETQRDVNQQQRIENGLKSGQLTTGEAARLEQGQARIDRMQANADRNGTLTPAEKARIQHAQNHESVQINRLDHNGRAGNPNSVSSQRMQADVQRDLNQQRRIKQGVTSGSLTHREAGQLERGQARDSRIEARAGHNGFVGAHGQAVIQHRENRQSHRIFHEKHDGAHS